jgi:hypothetical protein
MNMKNMYKAARICCPHIDQDRDYWDYWNTCSGYLYANNVNNLMEKIKKHWGNQSIPLYTNPKAYGAYSYIYTESGWVAIFKL